MLQRKYISLDRLSDFLDNIKDKFSQVSHNHKMSDITDYSVDSSLSSTSTNPVQNKVIDEEFEAVAAAMNALELSVDNKADASHDHDDSYYTKIEVDETFQNKIFQQEEAPENANEGDFWLDTDEDAAVGGGNVGSGGGADLLNENGVIKQEYLPYGFPYRDGEVKAILTDAKPVDMDGTRILLDEVKLYVGEEYTVTWNGVEYKSVCFVFGEGEEYYNCLGNHGALGGEANGMPFVIAAVPPELASDDIGFGAIVMPLDDSTDITISITGFVGTIQKIDEKYLPDTSDVFVVEVTTSGVGYGTNKSSQEIIDAAAQGKIIVLKMFERSTNIIQYFTYTGSSSGYADFSRTSVTQGGVDFKGISIYDYNVTLTYKTYNNLD